MAIPHRTGKYNLFARSAMNGFLTATSDLYSDLFIAPLNCCLPTNSTYTHFPKLSGVLFTNCGHEFLKVIISSPPNPCPLLILMPENMFLAALRD